MQALTTLSAPGGVAPAERVAHRRHDASAPASPQDAAATLAALLDDQLDLPPETRHGMTTHGPMALHALLALGAEAARLRQFHARWRARYAAQAEAPQPLLRDVPADDWRGLIGRGPYRRLRASFAAALARDGVAAVLQSALPALMPGVAAAAFHGVIRSAHAVESGHRGELAAALAYWAWRWTLLDAPTRSAGPALAVSPWAAAITAEPRVPPVERPLIAQRLADALRTPAYQRWADRLGDVPDRLAQLAAWAAGQYAATRSFTLLHVVTGLRAVAVLSEVVPGLDGHPVVPRAVLAAWVAADVRSLPALPAPSALAWPEVLERARRSDDDHVIKLVHACRDWAARAGEGPWLVAAQRAVG